MFALDDLVRDAWMQLLANRRDLTPEEAARLAWDHAEALLAEQRRRRQVRPIPKGAAVAVPTADQDATPPRPKDGPPITIVELRAI